MTKENPQISERKKNMKFIKRKIKINEEFNREIAPFFWVKQRAGASVCLSAGDGYLQEIFAARADEGFIGNGYDWSSLAQVFLDEHCAELQEKSPLTRKQICSAPIPRTNMLWPILFFNLKKPVKINP